MRRSRLPMIFPIILAVLLFVVIGAILLIRRPWEQVGGGMPISVPSGTQPVTFMSNRGGLWNLYTLIPDTGEITALTTDAGDNGFASYSTDGGAITFLSNREQREDRQLDPFLMDADGSNQRLLVNDIPTIMSILSSGRLNWDISYGVRPDTFAFVSLRDLNLDVYLSVGNADGTRTEQNLTRNSAVDWFASWSPDGTRLAFSSDRLDGNHEIFVIDADGNNLRQLTTHPEDDLFPVWTSDGRIIFYSERETTMANGEVALYILNPNEETPQVTRLSGPLMSADGSVPVVADIQYTADRSAQIYMSNRDGDWEIYYSPLGSSSADPINLTNNEDDDLFGIWRFTIN